MDDAAVLRRAAEIVHERQDARAAELERLYRLHARQRHKHPHDLGKPKKLSHEEALLLVALERNKYLVSVEAPNGNSWHGTAECKHHARGMAMTMMSPSRVDALWALWATVTDQIVDYGELGAYPRAVVELTEDHLNGSVATRDLRQLMAELRVQEQHDKDTDDDETETTENDHV